LEELFAGIKDKSDRNQRICQAGGGGEKNTKNEALTADRAR